MGIPKTVIFNLRYFPFKTAIKFPVAISSNVKLNSLKGSVAIEASNISSFMIRMGGSKSRGYPRSIWNNFGTVLFRGTASFGQGCVISVGHNAVLDFGDQFRTPHRTEIQCFHSIKLGHDCLISWDCLLVDTDFHQLSRNSDNTNNDTSISIGNHVWIGCRSTILKGSDIPDGCVVGANSNVVSQFSLENSVLAGNPARNIKNGISWKE